MSEITVEDLTIRDLFVQSKLDAEKYDPEMACIYCQYLMEGNSMKRAAQLTWMAGQDREFDEDPESDDNDLREIRLEGKNVYARMHRWRIVFKRFDEMVNLALRERCYAFVEEMVEIADDATDDAIMGAQGPMINGKAIRRAELMINTRKFVAGKLLPKVFGDKTQMELTGADGKDLVPTTFNIQLVPTGHFIPTSEAEAAASEAGSAEGHQA